MHIWDLHCHLSGVPGLTVDERLRQIFRYADRVGIERMCFYLGMKWVQDPTPEELRKSNDDILQVLKIAPDRAFGFVYLNPKHLDFSLSEIERCVANGPMVGIKLWVAQNANHPSLDPIIRRAGELKAVIFQHTWFKTGGNPPGESTPANLVELAARHPDVPIICGHTGGNWELGIRAIRDSKNLSSDLAGSDPTTGYAEMAVRELGADRVIYGTDCGGRSFASQLSKVHGAEISDADKQKIFRDNLRRMMLPILTAKGIKA